jgi:hypothetical protein
MQVTDCAVGTGAVRTRKPLARVWRSKAGIVDNRIDAAEVCGSGGLNRSLIGGP